MMFIRIGWATAFQCFRSLPALPLLLLAMISGAAAQTLALHGYGTLRVGQRGAATTITLRRLGLKLRAVLPPDNTVYAHTLETSELLGAAPDAYAVISSDYSSNPGGDSTAQCAAGTETVVRVIALRPVLHQTFNQLVESCWTNVDAGNVDWDDAQHRLTIERTTVGPPAPNDTNINDIKVFDTRTIYQLASDGAVTVLSIKSFQ